MRAVRSTFSAILTRRVQRTLIGQLLDPAPRQVPRRRRRHHEVVPYGQPGAAQGRTPVELRPYYLSQSLNAYWTACMQNKEVEGMRILPQAKLRGVPIPIATP